MHQKFVFYQIAMGCDPRSLARMVNTYQNACVELFRYEVWLLETRVYRTPYLTHNKLEYKIVRHLCLK